MPITRNFQLAYPDGGLPDRFVNSTFSPNSVGDLGPSQAATAASAVWPTANQALFFPFVVLGQDGLDDGRTYYGAIWMNGATASGNIDVGIYDMTGVRLASIGSTAQTGTTAPQRALFSAPYQAFTGRYFLGVVMDNGVGTLVRSAPTAAVLRSAGARSRVSSFALPANAATWVGTTQAYLPWVGLLESTSI